MYDLENLHEAFQPTPTRAMIDMTKLTAFKRCPRAYLMRYLLGWDAAEPSIHLHFGKAWHKGLEFLYRNGLNRIDGAGQAFTEKFLTQNISHEKKTHRAGLLGLLAYAEKYQDDMQDWTVIAVESPYTVPISEERFITVNRDLVLADDKGRHFVMEHKTASQLGRTYHRQWLLSPQVNMYALATFMERETAEIPHVIVNTTAFYAKERIEFMRCPIYPNADTLELLLWDIHRVWDDIEYNIRLLWDNGCTHRVLRAFPMNQESCGMFSGCIYHDVCTGCKNPINLGFVSGYVTRFWNPEDEYAE